MDLAVANDGPPDGVTLGSNTRSNHFRSRSDHQQQRAGFDPSHAKIRGPAETDGPPVGPQTPSTLPMNGRVSPCKVDCDPTVSHKTSKFSGNIQNYPPRSVNAVLPPNPLQQPPDSRSVARPMQLPDTSAPQRTPPQDSSSSVDHQPPVGFFTARAAESIQKGAAVPSNVPLFNPHLESPSIRKTAGVDHTKSKPVRTEAVGAPLPPTPTSTTSVAAPPRTNFVNAQVDKARRVGMPVGIAIPLKNRGSYKPPQIKRPAEAAAVP